MVVVAILVALLAMLMPSMSAAVTQAQRAVCLSNIHQQFLAQINYASDNTGTFPTRTAGYSAPDYHRRSGNPNSPASRMRGSYMTNLDILLCPLVEQVPQQGGIGVYQRHDWISGAYGGWETNAANVYTAYMWFAAWPNAVTYYNGTRPFPQRASDLGGDRPFITHRLNFFGASNSHEISHGGRGLANVGVAPFGDYQTTDMPLGSGDGSGLINRRSDILTRYLDHSGTGTFLW